MSREDAKPEAVAKIEERRDGKVMESRASGPGAAAAAGREHARAAGQTAAAVGETAIADASASAANVVEQLQRDLPRSLQPPVAATLQSCLDELKNLRGTVSNVKETVDELWAKRAAAELRGNLVAEGTVKAILEAAVKNGAVGALVTALIGAFPK
ncbi:MAG: hypothetical protein KC657_38110 [Myxococcales bacterium]|nr:hypothetical protein [Myxococcales bacterium]